MNWAAVPFKKTRVCTHLTLVFSVVGETVDYQYDSLNRLTKAETTGNQWGNEEIRGNPGQYPLCEFLTTIATAMNAGEKSGTATALQVF